MSKAVTVCLAGAITGVMLCGAFNTYQLHSFAETLGKAQVDINRLQQQVRQQDAALTRTFPAEYSRHAWSGLTQEQVIALGEAVKELKLEHVTLYCSNVNCNALRADFDDAFQIGDVLSRYEDRYIDVEGEEGVFVGPSGGSAGILALAIQKATGIAPTVLSSSDWENGLGVVIGKRPSK